MDIPEPIQNDLDKIGGINALIKSLPKSKTIEDLSKIFHGLSDKYRLKILMIVAIQPVCVCVIKRILKISDSKLSYHLSTLKDTGLVYSKQEGNWVVYYPTDSGKLILNFLNKNMTS
jgi:ArsR family transcriptional regulator